MSSRSTIGTFPVTNAESGRVLVFQHLPEEDPGALGPLLVEAGFDLTTVELDHGDVIPDLNGFDILLVMGGPMDVWQEDEHPWLVQEKAAIHQWVRKLERPFLGVCLGHQLLADALGGAVGPMDVAEIGVPEVLRTVDGRRDDIFSHLPDALPGLQWHHAEVTDLPPDGVKLATNESCAVQALRVGRCAWGVQFHLEVGASTIDEWAKVPEYEEVLAHSGHDDPQWLHKAVADRLEMMRSAAWIMMDGLLAHVLTVAGRPMATSTPALP